MGVPCAKGVLVMPQRFVHQLRLAPECQTVPSAAERREIQRPWQPPDMSPPGRLHVQRDTTALTVRQDTTCRQLFRRLALPCSVKIEWEAYFDSKRALIGVLVLCLCRGRLRR